VGQEGSCSKRTSPSLHRPVQVGVAGHQPFASHYRRTHDRQDHLGPGLTERREGAPNCRTKRLRQQLASWEWRIVSVEAEGNFLVGGSSLVEEGGIGYKHFVEGKGSPVAGGRVNLVVTEGNLVAVDMALGSEYRPEVAETVWTG